MNKQTSSKEQVLREVEGWTEKGIGVTRATLCGALARPSNEVTPRVTDLLREGSIVENGAVRGPNGRARALLWAA